MDPAGPWCHCNTIGTEAFPFVVYAGKVWTQVLTGY